MALTHNLYQRFCKEREETGTQRHLRTMQREVAGRVDIGERTLINFSSNDYLGLSHHPELIARSIAYTERFGTGSGASRLVCGNLAVYGEVEAKLAQGKKTEAAIVLASGFQANTTLIAALLNNVALKGEPLVFTDRLNHASLHLGCAAAGVRQIRYHHNDLNHLESLLRQHVRRSGTRFIITESVFSMDGDLANLAELIDLKNRFGAFLYLDEAHATGLFGPNGFGLSAQYPNGVDLVMGTFSKALGCFGGYAACSLILYNYLVNTATGLIYSTALPPGTLGAMEASLDLLPQLDEKRKDLFQKSSYLRQALQEAGLDTGLSSSHIIPIILGEEKRTLAISQALEEEGFLSIAIRPPTVAKGSSRLRLSLTTELTYEDMDRLIDLLPQIAARFPSRLG